MMMMMMMVIAKMALVADDQLELFLLLFVVEQFVGLPFTSCGF